MLPVRMLFVKWRGARVCPARQDLPKGAGGASIALLRCVAATLFPARGGRLQPDNLATWPARITAALPFLCTSVHLLGGQSKGNLGDRLQGTGNRE
jgi:hypothetical protein